MLSILSLFTIWLFFFFFLVTYWVFGKLGVILPLLTYSIFFKVHLGGNVFIKIYCPLSQGC